MRQKSYGTNIDNFINQLNSFYRGVIISIEKIHKDPQMIARSVIELDIKNINTGKVINKSFLYPVLPKDKEIKSLYKYLEDNFNQYDYTKLGDRSN